MGMLWASTDMAAAQGLDTRSLAVACASTVPTAEDVSRPGQPDLAPL